MGLPAKKRLCKLAENWKRISYLYDLDFLYYLITDYAKEKGIERDFVFLDCFLSFYKKMKPIFRINFDKLVIEEIEKLLTEVKKYISF